MGCHALGPLGHWPACVLCLLLAAEAKGVFPVERSPCGGNSMCTHRGSVWVCS